MSAFSETIAPPRGPTPEEVRALQAEKALTALRDAREELGVSLDNARRHLGERSATHGRIRERIAGLEGAIEFYGAAHA